ncbi:MAG: hypothetical protein AB1371_01420 [Pseudomonadota bacterium]
MDTKRFALRVRWQRWLPVALLAAAGAAQAGDVYWSIGVHQPGVTVGVGNVPPVIVAPAPRVVMVPPVPVVVSPAVVYTPVYGYAVPPGHRKHRHWHRGHDEWRGWRDDDWRRHDGWRDRR